MFLLIELLRKDTVSQSVSRSYYFRFCTFLKKAQPDSRKRPPVMSQRNANTSRRFLTTPPSPVPGVFSTLSPPHPLLWARRVRLCYPWPHPINFPPSPSVSCARHCNADARTPGMCARQGCALVKPLCANIPDDLLRFAAGAALLTFRPFARYFSRDVQ